MRRTVELAAIATTLVTTLGASSLALAGSASADPPTIADLPTVSVADSGKTYTKVCGGDHYNVQIFDLNTVPATPSQIIHPGVCLFYNISHGHRMQMIETNCAPRQIGEWTANGDKQVADANGTCKNPTLHVHH